MSVVIENLSLEPVALPFPLRGVLKAKGMVVVGLTEAQVQEAIGTNGALRVRAAGSSDSDQTFYEGWSKTGLPETVSGWYETLAASQTANVVNRFGNASLAWVAPRAGSVVAMSFCTDSALDAAVSVFLRKNGTRVAAVTATASSGTTARATFNRGTYTFAAGDKLTLEYDSGTLGGTPLLCADLEVEMTARS